MDITNMFFYSGEAIDWKLETSLEEYNNDYEWDNARVDLDIIKEINPVISKKIKSIDLDYEIRRYLRDEKGNLVSGTDLEDITEEMTEIYEIDDNGYVFEDVTSVQPKKTDSFALCVLIIAYKEFTSDEITELTRILKVLSTIFYLNKEFKVVQLIPESVEEINGEIVDVGGFIPTDDTLEIDGDDDDDDDDEEDI